MQESGEPCAEYEKFKAAIIANAARNLRPNVLMDERVTCVFGFGERRLRTLVPLQESPTTGNVDSGSRIRAVPAGNFRLTRAHQA
jgi:hypothetical protein